MQQSEIMIKESGFGKDAVLRTIRKSGILLNFMRCNSYAT